MSEAEGSVPQGGSAPGARDRASDAAGLVSLACSLGALLVLGAVWRSAWDQGALPDTWGSFSGNHGPWRHRYDLRGGLISTCSWPLLGLVLAFGAVASRPRPRAVAALVVSLAVVVVLMNHYWLID